MAALPLVAGDVDVDVRVFVDNTFIEARAPRGAVASTGTLCARCGRCS